MSTVAAVSIPTYPLRPINGGPWTTARRFPKPGTWYYEPKYNGWRTLVHAPTGSMFNRHGQRLSIEHDFAEALEKAKALNIEWLDCEALERRHGLGRGTLIVLDALLDNTKLMYHERRYMLHLAQSMKLIDDGRQLNKAPAPNSLVLVPSYTDPANTPGTVCPDGLWDILKQCNAALGCEFYEGFVAKRADSTYPRQLRSDDEETRTWVKHRWAF